MRHSDPAGIARAARPCPPGCCGGCAQIGTRLDVVAKAGNVKHLFSGQTERCGILTLLELQGQHAHAHQVAAVDALRSERGWMWSPRPVMSNTSSPVRPSDAAF